MGIRMGPVSEPARKNTQGVGICQGRDEAWPHLADGAQKLIIWREAPHQRHQDLILPAGHPSKQFKIHLQEAFFPSLTASRSSLHRDPTWHWNYSFPQQMRSTKGRSDKSLIYISSSC